MANDLKYDTATRTAQAQAVITELGANSVLRCYGGAIPANITDPAGTELATATAGATIGTAANGAVTVTPFSGVGVTGAGAGTQMTYYRWETSGAVVKQQGTIGLTAGTFDLEVDVDTIADGDTFNVTGGTITRGNVG